MNTTDTKKTKVTVDVQDRIRARSTVEVIGTDIDMAAIDKIIEDHESKRYLCESRDVVFAILEWAEANGHRAEITADTDEEMDCPIDDVFVSEKEIKEEK